MKTDLYTKTVLTVIATCLCIIVLKETDLIPKAQAAGNASFNPAAKYGLVPVNADGSVNVKITNYENMRVEIDRVNCTLPVKSAEALEVKIKDVSSGAFYSCPVPVKMSSSSDVFPVKIKEVESGAFFSCTVPVKMKQ